MKPRFVSALAVLFCCAVLAVVGLFGYSRYRAAQVNDEAFRQQLQSGGTGSQAPIGAVMPAQLPPRASSAAAAASPQPAQ
jgi:hypothetical protein